MEFKTIAAISTPHGKGGVALLRISGDEALEVAGRVFSPAGGKAIVDLPPRYQIYGNILSADGKTVLDDGLLTYFSAPKSFTGENVVEIACHGGEVISSMVLSAILEAGAVMAGPGEFSRRAFVNGKLSLTAAEGIADLLDAKTDDAALLSSKTVRGRLSAEIERISDMLLSASSSLWAYLDYPEEDLQSLSDEELTELLWRVVSDSERLLQSYDIGRAVGSGIDAVVVGKPNVGKSTFFNRILGEEKAIVTSIPGTTRDVIEYPLKFGKVFLNLSDTAGVRGETDDMVEEIGIEKAISALDNAEVIFVLLDLSRPFEEDDRKILERVLKRKDNAMILPVLTKADLERKLDEALIPFEREECFFSSPENTSFDFLVKKVEERFIYDESALREGRVITNARQKADLSRAIALVREGIVQITIGEKDVASLTLESALSALLEIDGKSAGDKILDEVFSRFCIGK